MYRRSFRAGDTVAEATFLLTGVKKDEKRLRSAAAKWTGEKGRFGNLSVTNKDVLLRTNPALSLQVPRAV